MDTNKKELENDVLDMTRTYRELSIIREYLENIHISMDYIIDKQNEGLDHSDLDKLTKNLNELDVSLNAIEELIDKLTDKISNRILNAD